MHTCLSGRVIGKPIMEDETQHTGSLGQGHCLPDLFFQLIQNRVNAAK